MHRTHTVAISMLVSALGPAFPIPCRPAGCELKALELPVTMVSGRPITTVGINGTDVKLLVDSGAFYSSLTDAAAEQLRLHMTGLPFSVEVHGVTGEMKARKTVVKRLQFANGVLADIDFIVGGNEAGGGAMGLLGRNLLDMADAEYDLAHGAVRLLFPEGDCPGTTRVYWADSTPVSKVELLDETKEASGIRGRASLNGKSIEVIFDTGATSIVSRAAAERAGITSDQLEPVGQKVMGVGRGLATAWTAPIRSFEIGGERITDTRLWVADINLMDADMLIGADFFLSHRIYVARDLRTIYFTYNGGPVFALDEAAASDPPNADRPEDAGPPTDGAGHARRGAAAAARGDYTRALADLNRACALEPSAASHFTRRGEVQLALEQPERARQDFDEALRLDPAENEARLYRARLKAASADRDGAIEDLKTLDQTLAPQAHMRLEMSRIYRRLDRYDQALQQLNQWIAAHPNEITLPSALNERCWARAMLNIELDQALADCNAALKQRRDEAAFFDSRAWVRLRQERWGDAVADFDRALKDRPMAWSLYGRGIARIRQGDRERGRTDIESARQMRPSIDEEAGRHDITVP